MVYDRWTVEPAISNTFDIYLIYLSNILCVLWCAQCCYEKCWQMWCSMWNVDVLWIYWCLVGLWTPVCANRTASDPDVWGCRMIYSYRLWITLIDKYPCWCIDMLLVYQDALWYTHTCCWCISINVNERSLLLCWMLMPEDSHCHVFNISGCFLVNMVLIQNVDTTNIDHCESTEMKWAQRWLQPFAHWSSERVLSAPRRLPPLWLRRWW